MIEVNIHPAHSWEDCVATPEAIHESSALRPVHRADVAGARFALENRIATGRMFPESFARDRIHRLAGFVSDFRAALVGLANNDKGRPLRAGILTPWPANDACYQHTHIARSLGLALLEGEDLTLQDARAMLRTNARPQPPGVPWRRVDAGFADPLELDPASRIGTPGLREATRDGRCRWSTRLARGRWRPGR